MSRREFYLVLHDVTDDTDVYFVDYGSDPTNPVARWTHDVTHAIEMSKTMVINTETMVRTEPWFQPIRFVFRHEAAPRPTRWLACPRCGRRDTTPEDLPNQACGAKLPNRKTCDGTLTWHSDG